jgi:hypothetical protein
LIVKLNLITTLAMVTPRLIVVPGILAKGVEYPHEVVQVLESNVLFNYPNTSLHTVFS